MTKEARN